MRIGGQYVGLGVGDSSDEIREIKAYMRKKFSYAKGLADNGDYTTAVALVVTEMQKRYRDAGKLPANKYIAGVINAETKYVMGYLERPAAPDTRGVFFTVCGTGVPWWVGPDADTARAVEHKYLWQPIGYPAAAVPMGPSIAVGRAELRTQFAVHRPRVEKFGAVLGGYSQGGCVVSEAWEQDIKPADGVLHWAMPHIKKAVVWGNPCREKGKAFPDPGGTLAPLNTSGVATPLMVDTPSWWRNYAHKGDMYAASADDESREDKTAIWQIIRGTKVFSGPDNLLKQFLEVAKEPVPGAIGAFKAMFDTLIFFGSGTRPHITYDPRSAIDYLLSS